MDGIMPGYRAKPKRRPRQAAVGSIGQGRVVGDVKGNDTEVTSSPFLRILSFEESSNLLADSSRHFQGVVSVQQTLVRPNLVKSSTDKLRVKGDPTITPRLLAARFGTGPATSLTTQSLLQLPSYSFVNLQ